MAAEIRAEPELATAEPAVIWTPGSNSIQKTFAESMTAVSSIRVRTAHDNSLDHLVGEREQPIGQIEAKRLSGLQVDDQLVFGRLLHRQIARLLAAQDTIDIASAAPEQVDAIRGIGSKPPALMIAGSE